MNKVLVEFTIKNANEVAILGHLQLCNDHFIPPLNTKVDVRHYAKKIFDNATTFEAWSIDGLVGLVAVYINDTEKKNAFVTNVSVLHDYVGLGIATQLLEGCISYARTQGFKAIALEVSQSNLEALRLYLKLGFIISTSSKKMHQMIKNL